MSSRRPLVLALCIVGLAGLGAYAWHANRAPVSPKGSAAAAPAEAPAAIGVEVEVVATQAMPDDVSAVGSLLSNEAVVLRPEVAGRISAIRFREGTAVKQGEVLVELDAAVQQAELQQAKASLSLAEADYRRSEDLFSRKFVSQSARDEAASRLEVARATTALAQARYERTRLRAPFAGVVGIRNVSVGDYVQEGAALVNLEDIKTLKVDFRLPEHYLQRIRPGQAVEVSSDALPGQSFAASVDAIDPLVDAQGRSVVMRARLANDEGRLRPGMFARVRLILRERPAVAVVSEQALMPSSGTVQYVYRVEQNVVRRVEVETGSRRGAKVEIVRGLVPGDTVVTAGHQKLRDGAVVRVLQTGGNGAASDSIAAPSAAAAAG